jgi:hypothetical protein
MTKLERPSPLPFKNQKPPGLPSKQVALGYLFMGIVCSVQTLFFSPLVSLDKNRVSNTESTVAIGQQPHLHREPAVAIYIY